MDLKSLNLNLKKKKSISDLICVDLGSTSTKVVRLRQGKDQPVLVGADILAPVSFIPPENEKPKLRLPAPLLTNYGAMCISSAKSLVRMINISGHERNQPLENQIRNQFSIDESFRVSYLNLSGHYGKGENRVLAIALPEDEVQMLLAMTSSGPPAPHSLEISGLTTLTSFMEGPVKEFRDDALCLIEAGAKSSYIFVLVKGKLSLLRKYDIGGEHVVAEIEKKLGVDAQMAMTILSEGAIDLSVMLEDIMGSVLRQLSISRDFVERQEKCRIRQIYLSGGMSLSKFWKQAVQQTTGLACLSWNPLADITIPQGAYPEKFNGLEILFASAIGAGLGTFQSS